MAMSNASVLTPPRSNSAYGDGNPTPCGLRDAPRRVTWTRQNEDYDPLNKNYSRFSDGTEMRERKDVLDRKLDAAEERDIPLCKRTKVDSSDSVDQSPWARKAILCLDGGGVKGYSSLLILKRLMCLIAELEQGRRNYNDPSEAPQYYAPNLASDECPWIPPDDSQLTQSSYQLPPIDEENEDLAESVRNCLQNTQPNMFKIHHYLDYISGTSTGGLSAVMLGRLEMSVQTALDQYDFVGKEVFGKPRFIHSTMGFANFIRPKYPSRNMEVAMISVIQKGLSDQQPLYSQKMEEKQRKLATDATFQSDHRRCRTIVLAHGPSDLNKDVKHTYVFRTYDHPHPSPWAPEPRRKGHHNPGSATSNEIWKVARATSAAPKYFSSMKFNDRTFLDGGIGANNPAKVALDEVRQMHRYLPKLILSIGTGLQERKKISNNYQKLVLAKGWRHVGKAMTYLVTQSEGTQEMVAETCENLDIPYCRWNVPGVGDIPLDEWILPSAGESTKQKILGLTQQYLSGTWANTRLMQFAKKLVKIRRQRAETERWEVFARQNVYYCPEPKCHYTVTAQSFETREELREHGICAHSYITNVDVENIKELNRVIRSHERSECGHKLTGLLPQQLLACLHNECGHESIQIFPRQEEFKQHLLKDHGVNPEPEFMSPRRMEAWLDQGRLTQMEAFKRHDSNLNSKVPVSSMNTPTKHNGKIPESKPGNGELNPPEMALGTIGLSTLSGSIKSGVGGDHEGSSGRSVSPTPFLTHSQTYATASATLDTGESSLSMNQLRQHNTAPIPLKRRSFRLQSPIAFRATGTIAAFNE